MFQCKSPPTSTRSYVCEGANALYKIGSLLHPEMPGSTMGYVRKLLEGDAMALSFTERTSLPQNCSNF